VNLFVVHDFSFSGPTCIMPAGRMRNAGEISDEVMRRAERDLDLEASCLGLAASPEPTDAGSVEGGSSGWALADVRRRAAGLE
jgi:hypothetical protein